jgi:hypothetical protein
MLRGRQTERSRLRVDPDDMQPDASRRSGATRRPGDRRAAEIPSPAALADDPTTLEPSVLQLLGTASVQGRIALGPNAGAYVPRLGRGSLDGGGEFERGKLCADVEGFSLDAEVCIPGPGYARERLKKPEADRRRPLEAGAPRRGWIGSVTGQGPDRSAVPPAAGGTHPRVWMVVIAARAASATPGSPSLVQVIRNGRVSGAARTPSERIASTRVSRSLPGLAGFGGAGGGQARLAGEHPVPVRLLFVVEADRLQRPARVLADRRAAVVQHREELGDDLQAQRRAEHRAGQRAVRPARIRVCRPDRVAEAGRGGRREPEGPAADLGIRARQPAGDLPDVDGYPGVVDQSMPRSRGDACVGVGQQIDQPCAPPLVEREPGALCSRPSDSGARHRPQRGPQRVEAGEDIRAVAEQHAHPG